MNDPYDAILIDAGTGNLHSVHNALLSLGYRIRVTDRPEDLARPARIILPGVGAFARFMDGLRSAGLCEPLSAAVKRGDPLLGICVGMQALFEVGEEMGEHHGLGLLPGRVVHFPPLGKLKVPHTGWNQLCPQRPSALFDGIASGAYAYFNHSYYCAPSEPGDVLATTDYGLTFASAVQRGALYAVQFHPEKSQRVGLAILKNFMSLRP
jgi:imidazole glycerol-phosphate synthase subunit HisH